MREDKKDSLRPEEEAAKQNKEETAAERRAEAEERKRIRVERKRERQEKTRAYRAENAKAESRSAAQLAREHLIILIGVVVLGCISFIGVVYDRQLFGPMTDFGPGTLSNGYLDWANQQLPHIVRSCQILFVASLLFLGLKLIQDAMRDSSSFKTALKLIISFTRYAIFIIAIIFILSAWGVDTRTLLISAGILGLIIGLGAQSLIADIIAGMFIVFDGEYRVGDVIVVNGWRGTVEEIGIRTTKIVDTGGNIKYINNSSIKEVVNKSQDVSLVSCILSISYETNLVETELKIKNYIDTIPGRQPIFVGGPWYKGVEQMADSSVDLNFQATCREGDYFSARRALNREIYIMANELGIDIPYNHVVFVMENKDGTENTVTARQQKKADRFVEAQNEASKESEQSND